MTKKHTTCAVTGVLFNGLAACGHHISCGNKCGVPDSGCEHKVEEVQEAQKDEG